MSVESMARTLRIQGLTPSEKLLLVGIANHDGDGGAWPSMDTLAMYCCASVRSVQRWIASLVEKGFVAVEQNAGGTDRTRNDRRPNRYILNLDGVTLLSPRDDERGDTTTSPREAPRGDSGVAHGVTELCHPNRPLEPSIKHEPSAVNRSFDEFWKGYPRKIGKPAASRAWKKIALKNHLEVMLGLSLWVAYWNRVGTEPSFIPYPQKWLNDQRWECPPETKPPDNGGRRWDERHGIWLEPGVG